jgi:hypothetical protein
VPAFDSSSLHGMRGARERGSGCAGREGPGASCAQDEGGLAGVSARWWLVGPLDSGDRSIGSSPRVINSIYIYTHLDQPTGSND